MTTPLRDPEQAEPRALLAALNFAGRRVLEVGCGEGRLTARLAEPAGLWVGVDVDEEMIGQARPFAARWPHLALAAADALRLPFAPGAFDIALLSWSL